MNDNSNLYIAVVIPDITQDTDYLMLDFDQGNDHIADVGNEDAAGFNVGSFYPTLPTGYADFYWNGIWWVNDTVLHGTGAMSYLNGNYTYEFSKFLNSGDEQDINLSLGDTVGFRIESRDGSMSDWYRYPQNTVDADTSRWNEWADLIIYSASMPNISVPSSIDLGPVEVGNNSSQTLIVSNTGDADLNIGVITLSGGTEFNLEDNCSGKTIAPLDGCDIQVTFSPTSTGLKSATLNIPSNDPDTPNAVVSMSGNGIDTTPPLSITNLHNTTFAPSYINWTWNDPPDSDFSHVMIYIDGEFRINVSKGTQFYNATGLSPDTEYTISTHTVDTSGNVNMTWVYHTARTAASKKPRITIHSPLNTTYSTNLIPLNVTADKEISEWWYNLNNTGNISFIPNTTITAGERLNHLVVYANDTENNTGMAEVYFTVDTIPPVLQFVEPTPENNSITAQMHAIINITSNETLNTCILFWNNTNITMDGYDINWYYNQSLEEGEHQYRVCGNDTANNWNCSENRTITVDRTPPLLLDLLIDPPVPVVNNTFNISFTVVEDNLENVTANLTYPNETISSTDVASGFATFFAPEYGIYNLEIIAKDKAGNENNTSIVFGAVIFIPNSSIFIPNNTNGTIISDPNVIIDVTSNKTDNGTGILNITLSPLPAGFGLISINESISGTEGIKYLNITSQLYNVTRIRIELHYTDEEVSGIDERTLAIFYWNGSNWINCSEYSGKVIHGVNSSIRDLKVFEAGNNPDRNYAYAVVNHTSNYGLGGYKDSDGDGIPDTKPSPARRRGGGGGGGGFLLPPTPTPTATPTVTKPEIKIPIPAATPIATATPVKSPVEVEETRTVKPAPILWWQQPTGSIAIAVIIVATLVVLAYALRRK
jgi:hypothetical protein